MRLTLWTAPNAPVRYAGKCVDKDDVAKDCVAKDGIAKDGVAKDGVAKDGVAKLYRYCTDHRI